jgi:hypothetical protein
MAMPMMDNDRPGWSVDETYAENQHGLERSLRPMKSQVGSLTTLATDSELMTDKKPLPDWVNRLIPGMGVANTRTMFVNTRLDFDMSSTVDNENMDHCMFVGHRKELKSMGCETRRI